MIFPAHSSGFFELWPSLAPKVLQVIRNNAKDKSVSQLLSEISDETHKGNGNYIPSELYAILPLVQGVAKFETVPVTPTQLRVNLRVNARLSNSDWLTLRLTLTLRWCNRLLKFSGDSTTSSLEPWEQPLDHV
jgi:hypothetical protein